MPKKSEDTLEPDDQSTENQKNNVRNALIERGLLLELSIYKILKQSGWLTRLHSSFWNLNIPLEEETSLVQEIRRQWEGPSEPVYRSIDLVASKSTQPKTSKLSSLKIEIVAECKHRTKENWVFYKEDLDIESSKKLFRALVDEMVEKFGAKEIEVDLDHLSLHEYSSFLHLKTQKEFLNDKEIKDIRKRSHHSMGNLRRIAFAHTSVFGPHRIDNVRNACEQVLGACDFQDKVSEIVYMTTVEDPSKMIHWRIYPVVIFDGPIWEVTLTEDTDLELHPIEWVTYLYSREGKGHLIDIVSHSSFQSYLNEIEKEMVIVQG